MFEGTKVVTANEMRRIEQLAYAEGSSDAAFMQKVGQAVAEFIEETYPGQPVTILAGKGNNGGDGYATALSLLEKNFRVSVIRIFPLEGSSPLCIEHHEKFLAQGGTVLEEFQGITKGIIVDALVGTGFKDSAEGLLAKAISQANNSHLPILSIDIPSGLNGTTGEGKVAIQATATLYLQLPKIGFYIGRGWDHVGQLVPIAFGLPSKYIAQAEAEAYLPDLSKLHLPSMIRSRHKYQAGYVLGIAGSESMPGAAALSSLAALRSGAGIVRLFHGPKMPYSSMPWEVILEELDPKRVIEECGRASAIFVGPGLGRSKEVKKMLAQLLGTLPHPTVVDADALFHMAEPPQIDLPAQTILTPHHQEMSRLLGGAPVTLASCQKFANEIGVTVVLKGGPTFVFYPAMKPIVIDRGDPGMATAGSGDVLTGIIAALLAQKIPLRMAAVLGSYLHALSGEHAAKKRSSYGMIASDLIEFLGCSYQEMID